MSDERPVLISEAVDMLGLLAKERMAWAADNKRLGNYEDAALREREAKAMAAARALLIEIEPYDEGGAKAVIGTLSAVRRHDRAVRNLIHSMDKKDKGRGNR